MKALSRVQLFATPWTVAYQVPPSMGFSRQEYWSGLAVEIIGRAPQYVVLIFPVAFASFLPGSDRFAGAWVLPLILRVLL